MHGSELADARAAVWHSTASRLQEVRDATDSLATAQVRAARGSPPTPSLHLPCPSWAFPGPECSSQPRAGLRAVRA